MGDVAMTVPVIRAFSEQHPDIRITVLTRALFKPFFRDIKNLSVYVADVKGRHKGVLGLYKLSTELKALQIDAVADLHNVLRSKILKLFFGSVPFIQIDKGKSQKKALISGQLFEQLKTTHQRYIDVFEALGFNLNLSSPTFPTKKTAPDKVRQGTANSRKWIGAAPFAAFEGKTYPLDLMKEVIAELSKDYQVLLFGGGQSEIEILNTIEATHDHVINLAGQLSMDEELDVISNLDVMISMDSGNAHLAAMLGIQVITLWGVTHPYAGFYPFNQDINNALLSDRKQYPKIPTSVYGKTYPPDYKNVMRTIAPQEVVNKVRSIT